MKNLQVGVGVSVCALVLGFGASATNAQAPGIMNRARLALRYARDTEERGEHVHADVGGAVTIPITTLYSVSTPMITETSTSTEVILTETSYEQPECSPSTVTMYMTVTKGAHITIEPQSSDGVEYSTVTEVHTAVSTIVKTLTNSASVTVIETLSENASGKDGISYPAPPSATPTTTTTTTTWSTITSGEPFTSTSFVVVIYPTPVATPATSMGGTNATVIVYPPGGDPQPTPSDIPIIVGAAPETYISLSAVIYTAVAVAGTIMCLF